MTMLPPVLRCVLLAAVLAGCATPPPARQDAPLLRLAPAALGRTLALQQQLVVTARGQTQRVDVLLEADADAVRLALVNLGQTVARLEWDGRQLQESRAAWWPAAVRSENVLSDLQLVWWPVDAVRAALPAGWSLSDDASARELKQGGEVVTVIRYLSPTLVELDNRRAGYLLRIESIPLN